MTYGGKDQGRVQDFKLGGGGAHLKKIAPSVGIVRVKNHDFTPKNHIFPNFRGEARRVRPLDPLLKIYIYIYIICIINTFILLYKRLYNS